MPLREGHFVPDQNPENPQPISWDTYCNKVLARWYTLLSDDPEEELVQEFLELHPAMIPGGDGDIGPGGHHHAEMNAVFRQPPLEGAGRSFRPDFMWVTRSTDLITPILIEIEKPSKRWFKSDGRPTAHFRDAHDQLADWKTWFDHDPNREIFRERYLFHDTYPHRALRPQYVLIYGRQSEFETGSPPHQSELTRKRSNLSRQDESMMTFDSLRPRWELRHAITVAMTAKGPRPYAISPTFGTNVKTGIDAITLGDLSEALERSVMISDERKTFLSKRWSHWQSVEREEYDGIHWRSSGYE